MRARLFIERVHFLCETAATEYDCDRLLALVHEINELLERREELLQNPPTADPQGVPYDDGYPISQTGKTVTDERFPPTGQGVDFIEKILQKKGTYDA